MKEKFDMYFVNILKNNYANFKGRARRAEYWYFVLFNVIIAFVLGFIFGLLDLSFVASLYWLAVFVPSIALGFRRVQDVGKPGWFIFIPIYGFILTLQEGEKGANEYGADPKGL
ncbi:DUF805 domain-containing protein [Weeksellaceae bacterium TAE3-ERU29]|nr:DUF805 domain-containing protein [Weeksellaceae bacterium TAE3-ERU29]